MAEIKSIKFFGRESDGNYEWQYDFIVNANSQNILASKSTNYLSKLIGYTKFTKDTKPFVIVVILFVLASTGIIGFIYFKNVQYQEAKQAAKKAINQDFIRCNEANLNTSPPEFTKEYIANSPEMKALEEKIITVRENANKAKIKVLEDSIEEMKESQNRIDTYDSNLKKIEFDLATGKIDESKKIQRTLNTKLDISAEERDLIAKKYNTEVKINRIDQVEINETTKILNEEKLAIPEIRKRFEEEKRVKAEEDKKSCQIVQDYKNKYEK
jgi:hypothetical protein